VVAVQADALAEAMGQAIGEFMKLFLQELKSRRVDRALIDSADKNSYQQQLKKFG
jgi:hypothetical protein